VALAGVASAQLGDSSFDQLDHPAILYSTRAAQDPVAALARRIERGDVKLSFDTATGYLPTTRKAPGFSRGDMRPLRNQATR